MIESIPLHGQRDSNSRHLVLETSALPTELRPFIENLKPVNRLQIHISLYSKLNKLV